MSSLSASGGSSSGPLSGPVLLVEDDADIREAVQVYLELHGVPVHAVAHGREALKVLESALRPSLILLDMALPVMDGHRLLALRKARRELQQVPVVIVSAGMAVMSARDLALYAATYDVAAFLKKPAEVQQILELVERHALKLEAAPHAPPLA